VSARSGEVHEAVATDTPASSATSFNVGIIGFDKAT
jgi:hypothetical protein